MARAAVGRTWVLEVLQTVPHREVNQAPDLKGHNQRTVYFAGGATFMVAPPLRNYEEHSTFFRADLSFLPGGLLRGNWERNSGRTGLSPSGP